MTKEQLRLVRDAVPFEPFAIHMADGRSFRIPHRDFLWLQPEGRIVGVYETGKGTHLLDVFLMTELAVESKPIPSDASSNGIPENGTQ